MKKILIVFLFTSLVACVSDDPDTAVTEEAVLAPDAGTEEAGRKGGETSHCTTCD